MRAYRSKHRLRQHHASHDEGADDDAPPILDAPAVPSNVPTPEQLIATQPALDALAGQLQRSGRFAFDTEFIGEQSYFPRCCVVQVATAERVDLIDGQAAIDLDPLLKLFLDPAAVKIVHAGLQDLEPIARRYRTDPQQVFDTQLAAAFTGRRYPIGLRDLIADLFEADMGRGLKFSQWDQRPLSPLQCWYAANDVRYLVRVHELLAQELERCGNRRWFDALTAETYSLSGLSADPQTRRLRGKEGLKPREQAVLSELLEWREQVARRLDVPPRAVLKDGLMLELARRQPQARAELKGVSGLPRPVVDMAGEALFEAVARGRVRTPEKTPHVSRRVAEQLAPQAKASFEAIRERCESKGIDPAEVMQTLVRRRVGENAEPTRLETGWRAELLGPVLDQLTP